MQTDFIKRINYKEFTDIAVEAKEELIVSMPNLHYELCNTIISCHEKNIKVSVIIDNSEDNYRNGYGEIQSISKMKDCGISIYNLKGSFISFIIADKKGYYIFPQSRIFTGDESAGLNAVAINPMDILLLKKYFFNKEIDEEGYESILLESFTKAKECTGKLLEEFDESAPLNLQELSNDEIKDVNGRLELNPPVNPDLKRKLTTYALKVQYVEFSFEGENISTFRVTIPKNALPIKDAVLKEKLLTTMRLFDNIEKTNEFQKFINLKYRVENLRKEYLVPLSSRKNKSVIVIERKNEFERSVDALNNELQDINKSIVKVINNELKDSRNRIYNLLFEFLKKNPPQKSEKHDKSKNIESVSLFAQNILNAIKFPKADKILGRIKLNCAYYDLTEKDFVDKELLKEFERKKIMRESEIADIVKISNVVALKSEKRSET